MTQKGRFSIKVSNFIISGANDLFMERIYQFVFAGGTGRIGIVGGGGRVAAWDSRPLPVLTVCTGDLG